MDLNPIWIQIEKRLLEQYSSVLNHPSSPSKKTHVGPWKVEIQSGITKDTLDKDKSYLSFKRDAKFLHQIKINRAFITNFATNLQRKELIVILQRTVDDMLIYEDKGRYFVEIEISGYSYGHIYIRIWEYSNKIASVREKAQEVRDWLNNFLIEILGEHINEVAMDDIELYKDIIERIKTDKELLSIPKVCEQLLEEAKTIK